VDVICHLLADRIIPMFRFFFQFHKIKKNFKALVINFCSTTKKWNKIGSTSSCAMKPHRIEKFFHH